jgi:excisionase family DNA binding protein
MLPSRRGCSRGSGEFHLSTNRFLGHHPNNRVVTVATPSGDLSLSARLAALAELLPEGASLVFDRASLGALAASERHDLAPGGSEPDLTVAQAAARLGLSKNRVRGLIGEGRLQAYRTGRTGGWHITPEALASFRKAPPISASLLANRAERIDLGRWRKQGRG